jgi:hypothetical protein
MLTRELKAITKHLIEYHPKFMYLKCGLRIQVVYEQPR